jgi:hypothetical protein
VFNGLNVQSFPAYNVSSKVLSNGDIVISWLATPNVEYDFFSNGYTAADFAYRVNILNASDIVRSEIARNVELFTYTTAMQLQDFNAVQEAVNFTVVPY